MEPSTKNTTLNSLRTVRRVKKAEAHWERRDDAGGRTWHLGATGAVCAGCVAPSGTQLPPGGTAAAGEADAKEEKRYENENEKERDNVAPGALA